MQVTVWGADRGATRPPARRWPAWLFRVLLAVLCFGPLAAPLLQASGLPVMAGGGALARDLLSLYVCPTPARSYVLSGFPMAVCARCWGAAIGLWMAWFVLQMTGGRRWAAIRPRSFAHCRWLVRCRAAPWPARLSSAGLPFLLWALEILLWPAAPLIALLLNGVQAGLWGGLLLCPDMRCVTIERSSRLC